MPLVKHKHSPGAFTVRTNPASNYRYEVVAKTAKGKEVVVARIPTPKGKPEEATANATVFSAVPEMIAALEQIEEMESGGFHIDPLMQAERTIRVMRAIAQAALTAAIK